MYQSISQTRMFFNQRMNPRQRDQLHLVDRRDKSQYADSNVDAAAPPSAAKRGPTKTEETYTVETAIGALGFGVFQCKLSLIVGLAWMADSMEMMILSILGPHLLCEWRLLSYQTAFITSVVFVGMGLGSPLWGIMNDKYGRKIGIIVSMTWTLYYGLLSAFVPVYGWLLVLRGLVGFGIGGAPQALMYNSEFLPTKWRGVGLMLLAVFWAVGALLEVLLALWVMPTLGWRWLLGLSSLPLALFLFFSLWLPESPRFDLMAGNRERAMRTLTFIAKQNGKVLPPGKIVAYKQDNRGQIKDLFTPQYRRTTLLLWVVWFAGAFSYYGIVLLTSQMFQTGVSCEATRTDKTENSCSLECNYLTFNDYVDILWTTVAEIPGYLAVFAVLNFIGRKKSMALSFFMFSLFLLPLYACIGRTALTIFIFIARAFISGGSQIIYIYTPEVFPTENRAIAVGTASMMARVGALITPFVAQVLMKTSLKLSLAVYICGSVVAGIASWNLPIETSGRGMPETAVDQEEVTTTSETYGSMEKFKKKEEYCGFL